MNAFIIPIFAGLFVGLTALCIYLIITRSSSSSQGKDAVPGFVLEIQREMLSLKESLQNQVSDLGRQMSTQQNESSRFLQNASQGYSEAVGQVHHRLGQLQEATQSMIHIGKDISSLQDILRAPKLRGGIGEMILAELLRQILPEDHYALQYSFPDGSKVDAVIILGEAMVPVDAKFPLENFKRILAAKDQEEEKNARKQFVGDVKKHIDAISNKYILPAFGTYEFALMYIPAENVYYETIIKDDWQQESISAYAMKKKVIPVSPNSFYAYLQAIVRGLKGMRIEQSAQKILESLGQLEADFQKISVDFEKVGSHLSNAQSAYDRALRNFEKLHDRLSLIEAKQNQPLLSQNPQSLS